MHNSLAEFNDLLVLNSGQPRSVTASSVRVRTPSFLKTLCSSALIVPTLRLLAAAISAFVMPSPQRMATSRSRGVSGVSAASTGSREIERCGLPLRQISKVIRKPGSASGVHFPSVSCER